jgi:two-component system sensor histidine kinase EvgS
MDGFAAKPTTIPLLAAKLADLLPHLALAAPQAVDLVDAERDGDRSVEVLDRKVLDELTGGDATLTSSVLRDYVESTTSDVTALSDALERGDLEGAGRQAHRIKGASAMVGAVRVQAIAADIEAAAGDGGADLARRRDDLAAAVAEVAKTVEPADR